MKDEGNDCVSRYLLLTSNFLLITIH